MPGSQLQSAEPVRRAAVVTHGKPEVIGDAVARLEAFAAGRGRRDRCRRVAQRPTSSIVLGGDGTMLRALQRYLGAGVPVLGVNFGRVGFLTSIDGADLEAGLARAFAGEYAVLELATLDVEAGDQRAVAVNDVVVDERDARSHGRARLADRRREPRLGRRATASSARHRRDRRRTTSRTAAPSSSGGSTRWP